MNIMKKFDENQIISQEEMNHISLKEACEMVSLKDPYNHDKVMRRLIGCFTHKGYDRIDQLKDVTIFDLIVNVPNAGIASYAVLIILLERFGIRIDIPDSSSLPGIGESYPPAELAKLCMACRVGEELLQVREHCVFTK